MTVGVIGKSVNIINNHETDLPNFPSNFKMSKQNKAKGKSKGKPKGNGKAKVGKEDAFVESLCGILYTNPVLLL